MSCILKLIFLSTSKSMISIFVTKSELNTFNFLKSIAVSELNKVLH